MTVKTAVEGRRIYWTLRPRVETNSSYTHWGERHLSRRQHEVTVVRTRTRQRVENSLIQRGK